MEIIHENELEINQIAKGLLKYPSLAKLGELYLLQLMLDIAAEEGNQELLDLLTHQVMGEGRAEQMRMMWPSRIVPEEPDKEEIRNTVVENLNSYFS